MIAGSVPSSRKRTIGLLATGVFSLGVVGACSADEDQSALDRVRDEGVTIAVADERPYSWLEGDEAKGGTVAVDEEIFKNLGVEDIEFVEVDWNSLIPGLNANRFDAVSAGMSILPDRCEEAEFANPQIMYTTTLMVPEGNPEGLTDLDSVKEAQENGDDIELAVLNGGIEAGYAEDLDIDVAQSVPDAQTGMDVVENGRADAFAMTAISLNWMVQNNPDAAVETTEVFEQEIDGVVQIGAGSEVFHPNDTELLEAYNEELDQILEDEDKYLEILGEYGFTEDNIPPADLTTEQLCKGELE